MTTDAQPLVTLATLPSDAHTRLHGRWLIFARVAWLAIAALFVPLRNRIQIASDERFYRKNTTRSRC